MFLSVLHNVQSLHNKWNSSKKFHEEPNKNTVAVLMDEWKDKHQKRKNEVLEERIEAVETHFVWVHSDSYKEKKGLKNRWVSTLKDVPLLILMHNLSSYLRGLFSENARGYHHSIDSKWFGNIFSMSVVVDSFLMDVDVT